jgi:hypothetical protein
MLCTRRNSGTKRSPLPVFYIGTDAAIANMILLAKVLIATINIYSLVLEIIAPESR